MFKIKKIIVSVLFLHSSVEFGMMRKAGLKMPKATQSYVPQAIAPYAGLQGVSQASQNQFNTWLLAQDPALRNKIIKHEFFQGHMMDLAAPLKADLVLQQKMQLQQEILDYMMVHPEQAGEIMNFYVQMRDASDMLTEKLKEQPKHFQEFFQSQMNKQKGAPYQYSRADDSKWMKEKILKNFNKIIVALIIVCWTIDCVFVGMKIEWLAERERVEKNLQAEVKKKFVDILDKDLVAVIELLKEALGIEDVPVQFNTQASGPYVLGWSDFAAFYSSSFDMVLLNPGFFMLSYPGQVGVLLHEFRHVLQYRFEAELPADFIAYAQQCNVDIGSSWYRFFRQAMFWTSPLKEFDADNFAFDQMKDSEDIVSLANEQSATFNKNTGYFSRDMVLKDKKHASINGALLKINRFFLFFLDRWNGENIYMRYVPEHLKQAAAYNRQHPRQTLFDQYVAELDKQGL